MQRVVFEAKDLIEGKRCDFDLSVDLETLSFIQNHDKHDAGSTVWVNFFFAFREIVQMQTVNNQPGRLVNMALFCRGTFPKQHWICRNCNNRCVSLSLDCLSFVLAFQFPMHKGWWSLGLLLYITYQRKRYVAGLFAAVNELFPN